KRRDFQSLASLQAYVLAAQDARWVKVYRRTERGEWRVEPDVYRCHTRGTLTSVGDLDGPCYCVCDASIGGSTSMLARPARVEVASGYNSIARLAVLVVLLYEAEIVELVEIRTIDVCTVNVALVLPAATVTLVGTLAAPLLLDSMTCAPPAGAGPLRVTLPLADS